MRSTTSFCRGLAMVLLTGAAGCGTAQSRLANPVIDTLPHALVRVRNSDPSQWLGTTGWKLVLERTIAADGGKAVFGAPISIAASGDTIVAFAGNQRQMTTLRSNGALLTQWPANYCCSGTPPVMESRGTDPARIIALPGKRTPVSAHAADSVFAPFTKRAPINQVAKRGDIPTEQPYFTGLHADEQDNIWIERPASNGAVAEFDVIDATGRFLGTVTAPQVSFHLPLFRNGRMHCGRER